MSESTPSTTPKSNASSLEIASAATLRPVREIARDLGIPEDFVIGLGKYKAKVDLDVLQTVKDKPRGKYILVTAMTPTPLGEGKTTTTIGLGMALSKRGHKSSIAVRQSSLGPVFGIKGGGAGGGYSQVVPLEQSILHLGGDIHAIGQAHNQLAAMTDNAVFFGMPPKADGTPSDQTIDPDEVQIRRVVDVNDRFLRHVTVGQGGEKHGVERKTGFDITVASELMAILALVDGDSQKDALLDLRARIGRMVVAFDKDGSPITADDVRGAGAATVLMRDALAPNLMQTLEGTPAFVHAGPFANIAHGNSSILADRVALAFSDYVVTEAGFGMDIGGEKFFDIKCRASGLMPDAAVLVCTVRALKSHSGNYKIVAGKPLPPELLEENVNDVVTGAANLKAQLKNLHHYGVNVVVAINRFPDDHPAELEAVKRIAMEAGAFGAVESTVFAEGGNGGLALAELVEKAAAAPAEPTLLYPDDMSLTDKIRTIAQKIYGADDIELSERAAERLAKFEAAGFGHLPICMAKTHLSLSHDKKLKGAPSGFVVPIRDVRVSVGAGFVYPLAGPVMTMPGLGRNPAAHHIDIDADGNTVGLF